MRGKLRDRDAQVLICAHLDGAVCRAMWDHYANFLTEEAFFEAVNLLIWEWALTHLHAKFQDDPRRNAAGRAFTRKIFTKNVVTMATMTPPTPKAIGFFA